MLKKYFDSILVFLCSFFIFNFILDYVSSDIELHINNLIRIKSLDSTYPSNFLLYFLINIFSVFSNDRSTIEFATIFILTLSVLAKYLISKKIISELTDRYIYILSLGMILFFAIPDPFSIFILKKMYLGKIVPNIWHNPTTILVLPFALLLFWKQLYVLKEKENINLILLHLLVFINVIIKPSFLFVYIPVTFFFLLSLIRIRGFRWFCINTTPLLTGSLLLVIQYYLIYFMQTGISQKEISGIMISKPFELFLHSVPAYYLPFSFLFSFLFPIISIIFFRDILSYQPFIYSLSLLLFGILISTFIIESGPRMTHGNFLWQNIICSYLFILSTILFLLKKIKDNTDLFNLKIKILIAVFFLHVFSGVLYLIKIGITLDYA